MPDIFHPRDGEPTDRRLRRVFVDTCRLNMSDFIDGIEKLLQDHAMGDRDATALVLKYAVGTPAPEKQEESREEAHIVINTAMVPTAGNGHPRMLDA